MSDISNRSVSCFLSLKPSLAGAEEHNVVHVEREGCSENWWGVRAAWGRGEKSGWGVFWTISELSALTPISGGLQPKTRGNGAGRRNKWRNVSW